ncbi:helix-turn-helix domain-containing protein [Streptomyces sp. 6N223]|uniref:helix-turn-helix domain-containing protein n=1 Tax=Streptomyces sp. 6N223 TaxID=3457412 RepID=UPI003FD6A448
MDSNEPPVFGNEVREVRTDKNMTQKHVANGTGYSEAYVCKVESGQQFPSEAFAKGCDKVFATSGVFERLRQRILDDESPSWFEPYLNHEGKASHIMVYSATLVAGMLQTEDYARAVFRSSNPRDDAAVIDGKVKNRLRRREVFQWENPPLLWCILHEACLRTVVGGNEVMAGQLEHLLTSAESPHIEIQVMPFAAGAPAAWMRPFILLRFKNASTLLYTENQLGGKLAYSPERVAAASDDYDRLRAHALSPDQSLSLIKTVLEEYRR